jgi:hypothetical protein
MSSDLQGLVAFEFLAGAARARADHYRDQAIHIRELAAAEPIGRLRELLLDIARQYEDLATGVFCRD